jgi:hypothetical protein
MRLFTPRPAPPAAGVRSGLTRSCPVGSTSALPGARSSISTIGKVSRRGGLLAALLVLVVAFAAPAAASASAGSKAAEWLASQLRSTSQGSSCELFGEESVGETIECTLAFKAAGSSFSSQREATYRWTLAHAGQYVGSEPCETTSEPLSAGAVAKLALAVEAQSGNPEDIEGRNLIADLKCLQVHSGAQAGRFADKNQTDYSDVTGQSLAIIALKACEAGCASKPNLKASIEAGATYLRAQQCAGSKPKSLNGAFRSTMGLAASTCNDEPPFTEVSENENAVEVDSTGTAVQALLTAGSAESKTAAESALKWLKRQRKKSRYWQNYCSFEESSVLFPSVNSTALAMMADVEAGVSVVKAQKWLDGIVEAQPTGERGLPACTESGPAEVLATAQGIIGMYGTTYPHLVGLP